MTARAAMTLRATVQRNGETGTDAFNQPLPPTFAALATVSCWAWSATKRFIDATDKIMLVEVIRATMPKDTDVTEADRIGNITDRQSTVIFAGPFMIDTIQTKRVSIGGSHLELELRRID